MQLVAYGAQDVYLTGNPQITFFKVVYRRHTNFSCEVIEQSFNGTADFGRKVSVEVTRNGDLVTNMHLRVKLPALEVGEGQKAAWVRRVGHALISSVEVTIGGATIDKQYGTWLDVWYELARRAGDLERGFARMVGDYSELTKLEGARSGSTAKPSATLFVPLQFWFNRNTGLALPLIALQYHEVRVNVEFATFNSCVNYTGSSLTKQALADATLLIEYVYLDSEERRRFAQVGHEYLIEQVQFTGEEEITSSNSKHRLNFNHPTKALVWVMRRGDLRNGQCFLADAQGVSADTALNNAAINVVHGSISTDSSGVLAVPSPTTNYTSQAVTAGGTATVTVNSTTYTFLNAATSTATVYIRNDVVLGTSSDDMIDRVSSATVSLSTAGAVSVSAVSHTLNMHDISRPVSGFTTDNRNAYVKAVMDVCVHLFSNYGLMIDGSGNPFTSVLLQLNGQDRQAKRDGDWYNYAVADQCWNNTPADGVLSFCFALKPAEHQPSGSANLSRIDSTQLNLWYGDNTAFVSVDGDAALSLTSNSTELFIYAFSYNVLRIMSGMGGLAYSN
jgi:hypothetical protein